MRSGFSVWALRINPHTALAAGSTGSLGVSPTPLWVVITRWLVVHCGVFRNVWTTSSTRLTWARAR